jgi:hypothetical protein
LNGDEKGIGFSSWQTRELINIVDRFFSAVVKKGPVFDTCPFAQCTCKLRRAKSPYSFV